MAKQPDPRQEQQIFFGTEVPQHSLFQKQVAEVLEQSGLDEQGKQAILVAMNCPPPAVLQHHLLRSPSQLRKSWYMFFFQLPVLPERFVAQRMPGMLVAGSFNRKAWNRESLTPYGQAFSAPSDVTGPINWYRAALRGGLRRSGARPRPIRCPVLVVWGVHDRFLGQEMVSPEALRSVLGFGNAATLVEIPTAGHFVQNEAPEAVNEALLEWLASHADHLAQTD